MENVYLTDVTSVIGQWLDSEFVDVPTEVVILLAKAYELAAKELDKNEVVQ